MNRAFVASGATHPFSTDDQQTSSFAAPVRPGLLRGLLVMVIRPLADPFSTGHIHQNSAAKIKLHDMIRHICRMTYMSIYLIWWGAGHRGCQEQINQCGLLCSCLSERGRSRPEQTGEAENLPKREPPF